MSSLRLGKHRNAWHQSTLVSRFNFSFFLYILIAMARHSRAEVFVILIQRNEVAAEGPELGVSQGQDMRLRALQRHARGC